MYKYLLGIDILTSVNKCGFVRPCKPAEGNYMYSFIICLLFNEII